MKKYIFIGLLTSIAFLTKIQAQTGMTTNASNKNAVLDLNTTDGTNTKGLLLPKVALTALNNAFPLSIHTAGMHVYNTATAGTGDTAVVPGEYYNDGTKWLQLQNNGWELTTNSGTNPSNHFAGTTDATDLVVRTNNTERMRVNSAGKILINTSTVPTGGTNAKVAIDNGTTSGAVQIKDGSQCDGCVMVSDANGVGTWFQPGNTALGTGIYRSTVAQTFPWSKATQLQTSQPIKLGAGGTYITSIRWWGTSNGPNPDSKTISAYFSLYKNGVAVDGIEYYLPSAATSYFTLTVNLLAVNCSAGDVLTIGVSPSIGGATPGVATWYTGPAGTDPRYMPSIVVIKL
ncbi:MULTISPECIES: hypothetical protein [Flavobacterium]|uniref:hypothetical protein n=1 Tax=Flavobacterium TaxID=237 RepID=UPI0011825C5D|nr:MULTISPECIES: hypothetical protein [Flavobacterium]MCR4033584.1 hypothetical protein [Flavobacterium panacis]